MNINVKSYLTPSIPKKIFQKISNIIEESSNIKVNLDFETKSSGPRNIGEFKEDLGFICSPPYYWLTQQSDEIELFPYGIVFNDDRNNNLPVYFSDILVSKNSKINSLDDLNDHIWAYNDTESLSGYFCVKNYMDKVKLICSGSHLNSIKMVQNNLADITCIDSNALLFTSHNLKKIGSFGPHPVQPIVIKKNCKFKKDLIEIFDKTISQYDLSEYQIKK